MDISELCNWAVALAALAYWADVIAGSHAARPLAPAAIAGSFFGAGAFNAAAWLMVAARCRSRKPRRTAPGSLIAMVLAAGLLCLPPIALALTPALVLLGLAFLLHPALAPSLRQAGLLLLGLGIDWGWPFLRFLHLAIGALDAQIAGGLTRLLGLNIAVQGNIISHGAFSIEILPSCASSSPLAGAVLAYAVVALYCRHTLSKADLPWLAGSLAYSIILTEIRLSLMVPSWADWNFWHNGSGVTIYELAALAGAALIPWAATRRALSPKAVPA